MIDKNAAMSIARLWVSGRRTVRHSEIAIGRLTPLALLWLLCGRDARVPKGPTISP
ncbi:MAG: hypothetical protein ACYSUT_12095 [Planctomycetota bacterium]